MLTPHKAEWTTGRCVKNGLHSDSSERDLGASQVIIYIVCWGHCVLVISEVAEKFSMSSMCLC